MERIRHRARLTRNFNAVPSVLGHEARLGQVFLNLLVNAAQALREGDAERQEICVTIRRVNERAVIAIRDTGPGMSPDVLARLFEPFFTTKPKGAGTGLGLAICQSIVGELGGEITVQSKLGVGTEFCVSLPTTDVAERGSIQPPRSEPRLPRLRIFVIDDEPNLRTLMRRMLNEHEVTGFRDAREALKVLAESPEVDAIFCDLMMPTMSGPEFFGELTRMAPELVRRVVFLTGGAFGNNARQFLDASKTPLVTKPFDGRVLRAALARVVAAN